MKQGMMRTILYGALLWIVPFIVAFFLWDVENNAPTVDLGVFSAIMAVVWAITFVFVAIFYSKNVRWNRHEGWKTGITWYATVAILEFVFIVGVFGNTFVETWHLFLVDLPTLVVTVGLGYIFETQKK